MSQVVETPKVKDLVPLPREVQCDDTMREFNQVLRLDIVDKVPLRTQLLLDRRHKKKKSLSRPAGYFRMSSTNQLITLATDALAAANVLAFFQQDRREPSHEEISKAVDSVFEIVAVDVKAMIPVILYDLRLHREAVERSDV